jgi:hypothetical protein
MQKLLYIILTLGAIAACGWVLHTGGKRLNESLGAEELCYPYMSEHTEAAIHRGKRFNDVPGLEEGVSLKDAIEACEKIYGFQTRR